MSAASDYLEAAILNGLVRGGVLPRPASHHLGLFTVAPTDAGGGAEVATGGGYARAAIPVADASWSAPADAGPVKRIANLGTIPFAAATADWNAGAPIVAVGLFDDATGGNPWAHAALGGTPRPILAGDPAFSVSPGALSFSLGGMLSDWLRGALLNHLFRGTPLVLPASLYAALHVADPTILGTGAEFAGGGYQRVAIARSATSWTAPAAAGTDTRVALAVPLSFPDPTADLGTAGWWAFRDAAVGGNQWFHGANAPPDGSLPRPTLNGDNPPQIAAGAITLAIG